MRILYLHQYFATLESSGGTRSLEFARHFLRCGHHVQVLTSSAVLPESFRPRLLWRNMPYQGMRLSIIRAAYSNRMGFFRRVVAFLIYAVCASVIGLFSKVDVVYATSTPLTIAIPGVVISVLRGVPLVFEVRDLWPAVPVAMGELRSRPLVWLARMLERIAYARAKRIIALSPDMAAAIRGQAGRDKPVATIPNGCDLLLFRSVPPGGGFRTQLGLGERPVVAYVGTVGRVNGLAYLVSAAAACRDVDPRVCFVIVGDGSEREGVRADAFRRGLLDAGLWVLPSVPKSAVPALLRDSTVLTSICAPVPALWANSANKFFDALAAGRPVAINYLGWQAELLQNSGAGVVLPHSDPQVGGRILASLIGDTGRLEQAARAAASLASAFDRERLASMAEQELVAATEGSE